MHLGLVLRLLALVGLANGAPVLLNKFLGKRFAYPLDGGLQFSDHRPLFGSSKTLRGIVASVLVTTAVAPAVGLAWKIGMLIGSVAMAGDLFSSFCKRRMHLVAGSRATGLDQIPESLFPLLACRHTLSLTALDVALTVIAFFLGEVLLSLVFYRLHLRERPY